MRRIIKINKEKRIGKVLFIVEGKDEIYILNKIFTGVFDFQYEVKDRVGKYTPHNLKDNPSSSIFVINTKTSNIKSILDVYDAEGYLSEVFTQLINEYNFPVDKCTIFYIFDRDIKSNTDNEVFNQLIDKLVDSKESNEEFEKPGLLLLSYPAIESFTVSNFQENSFELTYELGSEVKRFLGSKHWANQQINKESVINAVKEMFYALEQIGMSGFDLDNCKECNKVIYDYEMQFYSENNTFKLLSLLCVALIDLGLIEID